MIRKGSDITLIGWGAQLAVLEQACEDAAKVSYLHKLLNRKFNGCFNAQTYENN